MGAFAYGLSQGVEIPVSGERGYIVARAEYTNGKPQYLVRYKAADGRGIESWWAEDALILAPTVTDRD